jgi:hypothetical protein
VRRRRREKNIAYAVSLLEEKWVKKYFYLLEMEIYGK